MAINMSYCRHENTRLALNEVLNDVYEHINEEAEYEVSECEIRYFRQMVESFCEFLQKAELLDEDGYLNDEALDEVCEAMRKRYSQEDEGDY